MRGLEWGRLYETYHTNAYNAAQLDKDVDRLRADEAVKNARGIYEYLLGGMTSPQLLGIRLFDDRTKRTGYERQTQKAKAAGISNCPLCALGSDSNKTRIFKLNEMDADHVTAWSKGGSTELKNLTMLCRYRLAEIFKYIVRRPRPAGLVAGMRLAGTFGIWLWLPIRAHSSGYCG